MRRMTTRAISLSCVLILCACADGAAGDPAVDGPACGVAEPPAEALSIERGLTGAGATDDVRPTLVPTGAGGALLVYNGQDDGVGRVRRLGADGRPLGPVVDITPEGAFLVTPPAVVESAGGFAAVWRADARVWLRRLGPDGQPLGPARPISDPAHFVEGPPTVAHLGGDRIVATWNDFDAGAAHMRRVAADGLLDPIERVTGDYVTQPTAVAAAPDGTYAVLWFDEDAWMLRMRRFDGSGVALGEPIDVGEGDRSGHLSTNSRGEIAVAWHDASALVRFFDAGGRPRGPEVEVAGPLDGPFAYAELNRYEVWPSQIAVHLGDDSRALVGWTLGPQDGSVVRIVRSDGQLVGPARGIPDASRPVLTYTAVAWLPCVGRALVAWRDRDWTIRVALLDPADGP